MAKALLLVLSNPAEGKDAEFNEWYTNTHVPEILEHCEGYVRAQRFKLSDTQLVPNSTLPKYLAAYQIEADDVQAAIKGLTTGMGSGKVSRSDSIDNSSAMLLFYEPITEEVTK